jgi:Flp pilus assembly protein TadB
MQLRHSPGLRWTIAWTVLAIAAVCLWLVLIIYFWKEILLLSMLACALIALIYVRAMKAQRRIVPRGYHNYPMRQFFHQ